MRSLEHAAIAVASLLLGAACHSQPPRQVDPSPAEAMPAPAASGAPSNDLPLPPDTRPITRPKPSGDQEGALPAPADVAAAPADASTSATGLASKRLQEGAGATHPGPHDKVLVHYTGWTVEGKMFDSSVVRGEPLELPLDGVIKGWTEGLQLMVTGEKRRFWIPAALAYGTKAMGSGHPSGNLTFDVELLGITPTPPAPAVPSDVAAAPTTAKRTASGLRYRVLRAGAGKTSPTAKSRVTVVYTGWTTDGKMFDTSTARGKPTTFPVEAVIPGWAEGVRLMHEGDVYRFWIPGKLAYGDKATAPGVPAGTLVFDVELVSFE